MSFEAVPDILFITGAMASGKSTVAQGLAQRLPKSVHLRGDLFRRMIVGGRVEMQPQPSDEARRQLVLRYDLACLTAARYAEAGFKVIYQDILPGNDLVDSVCRLHAWAPGVVVLDPDGATLAARDRARAKTGYDGGWQPDEFRAALREETPRIGLWLDTSALTVEETIETILERIGETRKDVPGEAEASFRSGLSRPR